MQDSIIYFFLFISGLSLGSFLNVLVYRLPNNISLSNPPSTCPKCNNQLKWYHNIPVFSWIFLKGKCGFCKENISIQYPIIELISGLLIIFIHWFNINYMHISFIQSMGLYIIFYLYLAMTLIDYKTHLVPDILNYPAAILSIFIFSSSLTAIFNTFILWSVVGLFFYFIIIKLYSKLRGIQVLGEGDIPILMGMAALLGLKGFLIGILISCIIGTIFYLFSKNKEIPFVPSLSIATFITLILIYTINILDIYTKI